MKILNVGCGTQEYGTDFVDKYPQREEVKKVDIDNDTLPWDDNTFDEVYSQNVLEHLTNLGHAIGEMARVCKGKGKIILITDNANYWRFSGSNTEHTGQGYKGTGLGSEDQHHMLFTINHISNLFEKKNIELLEAHYLERDEDDKLGDFIDLIIKNSRFHRAAYKRIKVEGTPQ